MRPFLLWAATRTASTTLSDALGAECEPFNEGPPPNPRHWVYALWRATGDTGPLDQICRDNVSLKHMVEAHDGGFNVALAKSATRHGYRHLHLVRLDTVERLVSLDLAGQLEAWWPAEARQAFTKVLHGEVTLNPLDVPRLIGNARSVHHRWLSVATHLGPTLTVICEDLVTPRRDRRHAVFRRIARFLELPDIAALDATLQKGGQDTGSIRAFVPNVAELRAAVMEQGL